MPNVTIFENVTFTVGGSNPQTKTVQVAFTVDAVTAIGTASASFTYTGTNGGTDTVTAALPAFGLGSNAATVAWQQTNGAISVGNQISLGVIHNGQNHGFNISSPVAFAYTLTVSSLQYNTYNAQPPFNLTLPGFNGTLASAEATPGHFQNITAQGTYAGTDTILQSGSQHDGGNTVFKMVLQGAFVVAAAGNYTINAPADDSILIGIQGATHVSGHIYNPYGQSFTPYRGFPILLAANDSASNNIAQSPNPYTAVINFPAPGIYQFEIDYNNYKGPAGDLQIQNGNSVIAPVAIIGAPSQPNPGTQPLVLTPTGGASNLKIQGQQVTLTLNISNVHFPTQPYIPLLEGSQGQIYVYNDPSNPTFSFQSYYGSTPDGTSAAANDFTLVGDNSAWQGQVSVRFDTGNNKFELFYNGSGGLTPGELFPANVLKTSLTITAADIAWFEASDKAYDTFAVTQAGGGKVTLIPIFYLLNPYLPSSPNNGFATVSPTTIQGDGTQKTFTVTLTRPLPPLQNATTMAVTWGGTQPTGTTVSANLGTGALQGWIVSYTVKATWATQAAATTATMNVTFNTPSLTILGTLGTAIDQFTVLTNYGYTNPNTAPFSTITIQAAGTSGPVGVSLTEKNGTTQLSNSVPLGTVTNLVATWISPANNFNNTTFYITPNGGTRSSLGVVTVTPAMVTSIGGGRYQAVVPLAASTAGFFDTNTYQFSFVGLCTDNSSCSFLDPTFYPSSNPAPSGFGGGGGPSGCFTGNVEIKVPGGYKRFDELPKEGVFEIENNSGTLPAVLVIHENYVDKMIDMGKGELVTVGHLMQYAPNDYRIADEHFGAEYRRVLDFCGTVYNLHVLSPFPDDLHYILKNGEVAHNFKLL